MSLIWIAVIFTYIGVSTQDCSTPEECSNECQMEMSAAGCDNSLSALSAALESQNFTAYCSLATTYNTCRKEAFTQCDQSLNKTAFLGGMEETYKQLCEGSPLDRCRMKVAICSQHIAGVTNMTSEMCSQMQSYLGCVKEKMKSCDPSVTENQVVGPMKSSFDMQCNAGGAGFCPAIMTCLGQLMTAPGSTPSSGDGTPSPDILQPAELIKQCSKMGAMMSCLNTQIATCNLTSPRSYTFGDVAGLFTSGCKVVSSNSDVLSCDQFNNCMKTFPFPSDPSKLSTVTSDPHLWCSMIKNLMHCGSKSSQCKSDKSAFSSLLEDINQVCPEAKIVVTVEDSAGYRSVPRWLTVLVGLFVLQLATSI